MDKEFFVSEMDKNSGMMFRVAYTILRNPDDCRDAIQEAALKAWAKRKGLREESRFIPWLMRILVNECYSLRRKAPLHVPLEQIPEPAQPPPDPTLAMALHALPEKLRLPLMLQYAEGMEYKEIAAVLHLPQSTVRGRIHRAKMLLRKELEA
ncbi:MAG: RNA polymerase sigma factor [Clostridiales bacterium]|nr:RNA polymerase sigma factor [Clostridiales bacterium]